MVDIVVVYVDRKNSKGVYWLHRTDMIVCVLHDTPMRTMLTSLATGIILIFAAIGFVFSVVFVGMQFGIFNVRGAISTRNTDLLATSGASSTPAVVCTDESQTQCAWNETPEWSVIKAALTKDAPTIDRVSRETGIPARMIAAVVIPEQTRFFTSDRELFKRVFEPLKILGSMSQFSLGVSGIKQNTAHDIETYAASSGSPYFPGADAATLIAYDATTTDHGTVLFDRLTDQHDHYYSYLYTALFIKEVEAEWQRAGYDIGDKPGVVATLFNLGFKVSNPKATPMIAGSVITTGGSTYVYGDLATLFYNSNELHDVFPK